MVSKNTIKVNIEIMYMQEKTILKKLFASIPNMICLTFNLWKPINIKGFISLTSHFVNLT